jgi:hypothetical protein
MRYSVSRLSGECEEATTGGIRDSPKCRVYKSAAADAEHGRRVAAVPSGQPRPRGCSARGGRLQLGIGGQRRTLLMHLCEAG